MSGKHEQGATAGAIPVSGHSQLGKALWALAKKAVGVGLTNLLRPTSCYKMCLMSNLKSRSFRVIWTLPSHSSLWGYRSMIVHLPTTNKQDSKFDL